VAAARLCRAAKRRPASACRHASPRRPAAGAQMRLASLDRSRVYRDAVHPWTQLHPWTPTLSVDARIPASMTARPSMDAAASRDTPSIPGHRSFCAHCAGAVCGCSCVQGCRPPLWMRRHPGTLGASWKMLRPRIYMGARLNFASCACKWHFARRIPGRSCVLDMQAASCGRSCMHGFCLVVTLRLSPTRGRRDGAESPGKDGTISSIKTSQQVLPDPRQLTRQIPPA
jgi:hypothetical protein